MRGIYLSKNVVGMFLESQSRVKKSDFLKIKMVLSNKLLVGEIWHHQKCSPYLYIDTGFGNFIRANKKNVCLIYLDTHLYKNISRVIQLSKN